MHEACSSKEAIFGTPKSVPPWTLSLPRVMMPPKTTVKNNKATHKMNLRPHQEEDPPWPVDSKQSSTQEAGSSRMNHNRHSVSTVHEGYRETFQCVMAKNTVLEQQNRKLTWSAFTSVQNFSHC